MSTLKELETRMDKFEVKLDGLIRESKTAPLIIKWIAFPLIAILGAAYGVNNIIGG